MGDLRKEARKQKIKRMTEPEPHNIILSLNIDAVHVYAVV